MQTIDEVREHCRLVGGGGGEKAVVDGDVQDCRFCILLSTNSSKDHNRA